MSQEKLPMKKLKEILRLKYDGSMSNRAIARATLTSISTVSYYTRAFIQSGLRWHDVIKMDERDLVAKLSPYCMQLKSPRKMKVMPDFTHIHQSMKRKGVTLHLLWEEYTQRYALSTYSYPEYCRQYRQWRAGIRPSMRQIYKAGEKCLVDYAGPTVPIVHPKTGDVRQAVIFVGVLGASHYTYAEATWTRGHEDWLGSHTRMFGYFGGVTDLVIPDNEKAGVHSACYYDPVVNPHYAAWAAHYNTVVLPTRPYHPRDKAKAETAVQIVERWILARLRHYTFFSLSELNTAIVVLLEELNDKPFKKQPGTRRSQFEAFDQPALKPLPDIPYEFAQIKSVKVRLDYHVCVDKHYYSVPYHYLSQRVECRLSAHTVEMYQHGIRIASHARCREQGGYTTILEHMPEAHQKHQRWSPASFLTWSNQSLKAAGTGLNLTAASHVIHFDRWWNPAVENQATDRAFRIGQKKNVLVHKFVCRGTIEEKIDALVKEKMQLSNDILSDGGEVLLTELDDHALLNLVSLDLEKARI